MTRPTPPDRSLASQHRADATPDSSDALRWIEAALDAYGSGRRGALRQCPAHHDPGPSLQITAASHGVRMRCYAGCRPADVLRALGLGLRQLYVAPNISPVRWAATHPLTFPPVVTPGDHGPGTRFRLAAEHPYGDPPRAWLMRWRHRSADLKTCTWESLNARGERVPGLPAVTLGDLPLYRERDVVREAATGELVVVCESESSVDALGAAGICATTWAGGATTPNLAALRRALGRHPATLVIADADPAGRSCAHRVQRALPLARVVGPDTAGHDARDMLQSLGAAGIRGLAAHGR